MRIIFSIVILFITSATSGQTQQTDSRKYFQYSDASFSTDEVKRIGVYFKFDSAALRPESLVALDSLINFLQTHTYIGIEIGNHSGKEGKAEYCMTLSQARAKTACDYLLAHGISWDRFQCNGYGRSKPIYSQSDDGNYYLQPVRRTEVTIISISKR